MKKYMFAFLCTVALTPIDSYGGGGPNSHIPKHGGRLQLAQGIEGKTVNFGFDLGGGIAMMDARKTETASIGAKGSLFIHFLVPKTKTLGIGLELGSFYLLASQDKFLNSLIATDRAGKPVTEHPTTAIVGNWLLPVGQVSVMGNFHPVQRFNIQLKVNLGVVAPMIPAYSGEYWTKEFLPSLEYAEVKHTFSYDPKMNIGFSGAVGMKLLYAINHCVEFGGGVDWSYLRFSYFKKIIDPKPELEQVITQMGVLDLHLGFAFSF